MRKAIFSLLVAVAAMPATAQLHSEVSPSSNHLHSPFFVKKTSEKTPSPMRHISPKAAPNAAIPYDVPFVEDFTSSTEGTLKDWYIQDVNNNNECWTWWEAGGCVRMPNFESAVCNDWLITPPINLGKDDVYTLTFSYRAQRSTNPESLKVTIGTSEYGTQHTATVLDLPEITNTKMETVTVKLPIEADGAYYIGFQCYSGTDSYYLWIDDVKVEQNGTKAGPAAPEALSVTPAANGALSANISFKAPSKNSEGGSLSELTKIKVYRDDEQAPVKTFDNPGPGASLSMVDDNLTQGFHTWRVVGENTSGEGEKAEATAYVGVDTPMSVTDFHAKETADGIALSWSTPSGINGGYVGNDVTTYTITRFDGQGDDTGVVVALNISGNNFTDTTVDTTSQTYVYYSIIATTSAGTSEAIDSNDLLAGPAYKLPYYESFAYGNLKLSPWTMVQLKTWLVNARWYTVAMGDNPTCPPTDGDDGMLGFYGGSMWAATSSCRLATPAFDFSDVTEPVLSFYLFHYDTTTIESEYNEETDEYETVTTTYDDLVKIAVSVDGGDYEAIDDATIRLDASNAGWTLYHIPLSAYKGKGKVSIAFIGEAAGGGNIFIDQMAISDTYTADIEAVSLIGPQKADIGEEKEYVTVIQNNGTASTKDYTVDLYLDNEMLDSKTGQGSAIFANGGQKVIKFAFAPRHKDSGNSHRLYAVVNYGDDQCAANDTTEVITLDVPAVKVPRVSDLTGRVNANSVSLSWSEPTIDKSLSAVTDDMESYTPFIISNIGSYTLIDNDKAYTHTIQNLDDYDNAGAKMAYQVFNPKMAQIDMSTVFNRRWMPYSGSQYLISFGSQSAESDDWLISPELSGDEQTISFWIKSVTLAYEERFRVLYSTDTNSTSDFVKVAAANYYNPSSKWRRFSVKLPEGAKYFAIHCISQDAFGLMVDDISYIPKGAKTPTLNFQGYNVYRNGECLNDSPLAEAEFVDEGVAKGKYDYTVSAVYSGKESSLSNVFSTEVDEGGAVYALESDDSFKAFGSYGCIRIANASHIVSIYTIDGKQTATLKGSNNYTVRLAKGIYLVNCDEKTIKVIVK